jgi:uncharacterized membrane-anchored protein YitT (DUF2179 family)
MFKKILKDYSIITFGAVVAAAAIYFFMLPMNIAIGSGSAVAMLLNHFFPQIPISVYSLVFNVIMLVLGFLLIGREFGAKTIYASLIVPISLGVYEQLFPNFRSLTNDALLDTICYILIVGIAMAILFSLNASSGGLDIVAKIMSKYLKMGLGTAVSISGIVVSLTSVFYCEGDYKIVVISVLGTYFSGLLVDKFIFGLNIKRRVCIISVKLDEIVDYVLHELHSGATLYESIGAYDRVTRREAVVIVDKNEYRLLMERVKQVDPKAFVTVIAVNELNYQPKVRNDKK